MTAQLDEVQIEVVASAIRHVLNRRQTDPDLGYLIGFGTESFDLLVKAEALLNGRPLEELTKERLRDLQPSYRRREPEVIELRNKEHALQSAIDELRTNGCQECINIIAEELRAQSADEEAESERVDEECKAPAGASAALAEACRRHHVRGLDRLIANAGGRRWTTNGHIVIDMGEAPPGEADGNARRIIEWCAVVDPVVTFGEREEAETKSSVDVVRTPAGAKFGADYVAFVREVYQPNEWRAPSSTEEARIRPAQALVDGRVVALVMGCL